MESNAVIEKTFKWDAEFIKSQAVKGSALKKLKAEIRNRIPGLNLVKLTDADLMKGFINVNGEKISTQRLLAEYHRSFTTTIVPEVINPLVDILHFYKVSSPVSQFGLEGSRIGKIIRGITKIDCNVRMFKIDIDCVAFFIDQNYMIITDVNCDKFNVISLAGLVRNIITGSDVSHYINLVPQIIFLVGKSVNTEKFDGLRMATQQVDFDSVVMDVRLKAPFEESKVMPADGVRSRNWLALLDHYNVNRNRLTAHTY